MQAFGIALCAAISFHAPTPGYATEASDEPFAMDGSRWMSFDHYKEVTPRTPVGTANDKKDSDAETANSAPVISAPSLGISGGTANATPETPIKTANASSGKTGIAPLSRPINIPVMPGMNKGFQFQVTSTAATVDDPPKAQITNIEDKPTVTLPESNWQSIAEATQEQKDTGLVDVNGNPRKVLNVRMSYLPNDSIRPNVQPKVVAAKTKPKSVLEAQSKPVVDVAACAAVDAYKKRQLDAIESDNKTLVALQSAIKELGLQKDLSFLTNPKGSEAANTKMDMPVSTVK